MKSVQVDSSVVGYIHQTKDGRWKSMTAKKAKLADHPSRHRAVKHVLKTAFGLEDQLYKMVDNELQRMDKKAKRFKSEA